MVLAPFPLFSWLVAPPTLFSLTYLSSISLILLLLSILSSLDRFCLMEMSLVLSPLSPTFPDVSSLYTSLYIFPSPPSKPCPWRLIVPQQVPSTCMGLGETPNKEVQDSICEVRISLKCKIFIFISFFFSLSASLPQVSLVLFLHSLRIWRWVLIFIETTIGTPLPFGREVADRSFLRQADSCIQKWWYWICCVSVTVDKENF